MLPEITESQLIVEEERRNTAPSIAYASHVIQKINPDATIVVAPSDHLILKADEFKEAILKGLKFASETTSSSRWASSPTAPKQDTDTYRLTRKRREISIKSRRSSKSLHVNSPKYSYRAMSFTGTQVSLYGM